MKFQDIILPLGLALLTTLGLHYFFTPTAQNNDQIHSGQTFQALSNEEMLKPLNDEIIFNEKELLVPTAITIETPHESAQFSTAGAALETLGFKRLINHHEELLKTLTAEPAVEREKQPFVIGLNTVTPYDYQLIDNYKKDDVNVITYQAENDVARITKEFSLSAHSYQLDLTITLEPKGSQGVQARLFVPGPVFTPQGHTPEPRALVYTDADTLKKFKIAEIKPNTVWASPAIFGAEDRYFIHALIADPNHFTQRAFYKITGAETLTAILEGPTVHQKTTWKLSFYCGPKELDSLAAVDSRLEETLEYGWFAPISKLLLYLLKFFYRFLHNYGLAIIVVTLLINLALMPLTIKGTQSMQRQSEFLKKKQYIEQKYRHDPERLTIERQELLKKQALSGGELTGCLPFLLQIPLFIALNRVLSNSIELYHAPFLWISDLSVKDPYYILPAFMVIGILWRMGSQSKDPRQHVATLFVALLTAGITARLSAGLTLFILVNIFAGVIQHYVQKVFKL